MAAEQEPAEHPGGTITALRALRRRQERTALHIDNEFCCSVANEIILTEGLRTGEAISATTLARIRAADERWRAKESALALLTVRPRARRELHDRLARRNFAPGAIAWAVEEADRLGLIDDTAFAEAWVRDRLRLRPRGARALQSELVRKGVAGDVARDAVQRIMGHAGAHDATLCLTAAEKWLRSNASRVAATDGDADARRRVERRLTGFLARRGFSGSDIRDAVRACIPR